MPYLMYSKKVGEGTFVPGLGDGAFLSGNDNFGFHTSFQRLSATNFVMGFHNFNDNNFYVAPLIHDGTNIDFGARVALQSTSVNYQEAARAISIVPFDDTSFMVVYPTSPSIFRAQHCTISGSTITKNGSPITVIDDDFIEYAGVEYVDTDTAILSYGVSDGANLKNFASLITRSGTTLTEQSVLNYGNTSSYLRYIGDGGDSIAVLSPSRIVVAGVGAGNRDGFLLNRSGNTLSFVGETAMSGAPIELLASHLPHTATRTSFAFLNSANSYRLTVNGFIDNGSSVAQIGNQIAESTVTGNTSVNFGFNTCPAEANHFIAVYVDSTNGWPYYVKYSMSPVDSTVFNKQTLNYLQQTCYGNRIEKVTDTQFIHLYTNPSGSHSARLVNIALGDGS